MLPGGLTLLSHIMASDHPIPQTSSLPKCNGWTVWQNFTQISVSQQQVPVLSKDRPDLWGTLIKTADYPNITPYIIPLLSRTPQDKEGGTISLQSQLV